MTSLVTELIVREIKMLQNKLIVLITCPYNLPDSVQLNQVASYVESLEFRIFNKTFADG